LLSGTGGFSVVPSSGCDFWSLGCEDSEAVNSGVAFSDGFVSRGFSLAVGDALGFIVGVDGAGLCVTFGAAVGEEDARAAEAVPVALGVVGAVADVFPLA
jgi:hypothetical protein HMPREF0733_10265